MKMAKIIASVVIVIIWCQLGASVGVEKAEAKEESRSQIEEGKEEGGKKRVGEEKGRQGRGERKGKREEGVKIGKLKRWLERWRQRRKGKKGRGRKRKEKGGKGRKKKKKEKEEIEIEEEVKRADKIEVLDERKWSEKQWGESKLGDKRRTKRAVKMGEKMAQNPQGSIPEQMEGWGGTKASYRLLNEEDVTMAKLTASHIEETKEKSGAVETCLLLNDISVMDTTDHPKTKNVEQVGTGRGLGFYLYTAISYNPLTEEIMGIIGQHTFTRTPLGKKRSEKWSERSEEGKAWEKEAAAIGRPPKGKRWIHVGDRGSDSFGFMYACHRQKGVHFLIRLCQNRLLDWRDENEKKKQEKEDETQRKMMDYARSLAPTGSTYSVDIPANKKTAKRTAMMQLTWSKVNIPAPSAAPKAMHQHGSIPAWVVRAWELNPPPDVEKPLDWVLLSSLPVSNWQQAHQRVLWYAKRWLIEEFFKCLKSGCGLERSQLDDRFDIERLLGFSTLIAVRLLQLRQTVRFAPHTPAFSIASPLQIHLLAHHFKLNPHTLTASQFWLAIARLGGYLNRRHDGPPGWITIWKGYRQLMLMTHGAQIALSFVPPPP